MVLRNMFLTWKGGERRLDNDGTVPFPDGSRTSVMKNKKQSKTKKKRSWVIDLLLFTLLLVGLAVMGYPAFSEYWNSLHQSRAIISYAETVANLDAEKYAAILDDAMFYNELYAEKPNQWALDEEEIEDYNRQLNVDGTGNMGFISIPVINVNLPIYHGTSESVLQTSIGHIETSSLPVGSPHENEEDFDDIPFASHSVLSGHRGLPSARLFSDLDQIQIGDVFYLTILDQTLTYEVDEINIVEPNDSSKIALVPDMDLCTLVTCTPYGINTHRLLVRGRRVENEKPRLDIRITADAIRMEPIYVAPFLALPVLLILVFWVLMFTGGRRRD